MGEAAPKKERHCVVAARVVIWSDIGKNLNYRAAILPESQLPRFNYKGICQIFSIGGDFGWFAGDSTPQFSKLEKQVEMLMSLVPPDTPEPEVIFVTIRPFIEDVEFREWGQSGELVWI